MRISMVQASVDDNRVFVARSASTGSAISPVLPALVREKRSGSFLHRASYATTLFGALRAEGVSFVGMVNAGMSLCSRKDTLTGR